MASAAKERQLNRATLETCFQRIGHSLRPLEEVIASADSFQKDFVVRNAALYDLEDGLEQLQVFHAKLEKFTTEILAWDTRYLQLLDDVDPDEQESANELYTQRSTQENNGGYLRLITSADDIKARISGRIQTIERRIQRLEQDSGPVNRTSTNSPATSESVNQPDNSLTEPPPVDSSVPSNAPRSEITELASALVTALNLQNGNRNSGQAPVRLRLPELHLQKFGGNILDWPSFWQSFESAYFNSAATDQQKLSHLKSLLTGEAAKIIDRFPITEDSYPLVIQELKDRFDDPTVQKSTLYSSLENLKSLHSESNIDSRSVLLKLREFTDSARTYIRRLEILGENLDLIQMPAESLRRKIPPRVMIEIVRGFDGRKILTVNEICSGLENFLKERLSYALTELSDSKPYNLNFAKPPMQRFKFRHSDHNSTHSSAFSANSVDKSEGTVSARYPCVFCGEIHFPDECKTYFTVQSRKQMLSGQGRCLLCLKTGHQFAKCFRKSVSRCPYCNEVGRHHRSICPSKFGSVKTFNSKSAVRNSSSANLAAKIIASESSDDTSLFAGSISKTVESAFMGADQFSFLATGIVGVRRPAAGHQTATEFQKVQVILDSGSNKTYAEQELAAFHKTPALGQTVIQLNTFGGGGLKQIESYYTDLELLLPDSSTLVISANVVKDGIGEIVHEKVPSIDVGSLQQIPAESLADSIPYSNQVTRPKLLIGADYFWELLDECSDTRIKLPSGLLLVPSKLGLLLTGKANRTSELAGPVINNFFASALLSVDQYENASSASASHVVNQAVNPNLQNFWDLEMQGIRESEDLSTSSLVLQHFEDTVEFKNGRYWVNLPRFSPERNPACNYGLALGRLTSLQRRFQRDHDLMDKYSRKITEQLSAGITELVSGRFSTSADTHYLPHHAVITPLKSTTKLRIVFDGSAKSRPTEFSLNECLLDGPNLIPELCGMILRFRLPTIVVLADVEKAFLNVGLKEEDRDLTRYLWAKDFSHPLDKQNLEIHRFTRIPFGVISSPFLLGAVIRKHLDSAATSLAFEIKENIYVDNVLIKAESVNEAEQKYLEAKELFSSASLPLREWISNCTDFNSIVPVSEAAKQTKGPEIKFLGLNWNVQTDSITVNVPSSIAVIPQLTKRKLLKMIAAVFDPMGFWTPATFFGKVLFQKLWKESYNWDSELPSEVSELWCDAVTKMQEISQAPILRQLPPTAGPFKMVIFTDASQLAYGATVFLVSESSNSWQSTLVFSKMRLKPVENSGKNKNTPKWSIPRLELMGVLTGVRAGSYVIQQMKIQPEATVLYTDSQCVLHWIQSTKPLGVFVANRIKEIKSHEGMEFRYVNTSENPADILTKGMDSSELKSCPLWWEGPAWLKTSPETWPNLELPGAPPAAEEEFRKTLPLEGCYLTPNSAPNEPFFQSLETKFSSAAKILRVTAYVLRFAKNCQLKDQEKKISGPLSAEELTMAETLWLKYVQGRKYADTVLALKGQVAEFLMILSKSLGLFLDPSGIIRCSHRFPKLAESSKNYFPILLPSKEIFTTHLIEAAHGDVMHSRTESTLNELRRRFWVPQGRNEVRRVLNQCTLCKRYSGRPFRLPAFPPLPVDRVEYSAPFLCTGLDYCGPFIVREKEQPPEKIWILLLTCLVTRAVHLEIVPNCSTKEFLSALIRFCHYRGVTTKILSDNATQFHAACNYLENFWKDVRSDPAILSFCAEKKMQWNFITVLSPWQGGIYERLVKVVKDVLRKSIGRSSLTLWDFKTILCSAESVINSRPLTYLSADIEGAKALCPADFLTPLNRQIMPIFPDVSETDNFRIAPLSTSDTIQKLFKKQEKILANLENRWRTEYLAMLKERRQVSHPHQRISVDREPKIGEVVMISENSMPHGQWKTGIIESIQRRKDGKIKDAHVRLPGKKFISRSICDLYPLEIACSDPVSCASSTKENDVTDQPSKETRPVRQRAKKSRDLIQKLLQTDSLFASSVAPECHQFY